MVRVGQNCTFIPDMFVHRVVFLPKLLYIRRMYAYMYGLG